MKLFFFSLSVYLLVICLPFYIRFDIFLFIYFCVLSVYLMPLLHIRLYSSNSSISPHHSYLSSASQISSLFFPNSNPAFFLLLFLLLFPFSSSCLSLPLFFLPSPTPSSAILHVYLSVDVPFVQCPSARAIHHTFLRPDICSTATREFYAH